MSKTTIEPSQLQQKLAEAQKEKKLDEEAKTKVSEKKYGDEFEDLPEEKDDSSRSYKFPTVPISFFWNYSRERERITDKIYTTSDPKKIEELDACVKAKTLRRA